MSLTITAVYAAIFALVTIPLSMQITRRRIALGNVAVGDGNDQELLLRRETLRNFAEYVPLGLILLGIYENMFGSVTSTIIFGAMFLFARLLHVIGFQFIKKPLSFALAMTVQHSYFLLLPVMILYEILKR